MGHTRRHPVVATYGAAVLVLVLAGTFARVAGVDFGDLTRDPIAGDPHWRGAVSQVGVLAWTLATGFCIVAAATLSEDRFRIERSFFLAGGMLSAAIALDDTFLLHELLTDRVPVGGQIAVVLVYGAGAALVLGRAASLADSRRRLALATLLPSLALLAVSLGWDSLFGPVWGGVDYATEDGTKLIGAFGWAAAFGVCAVDGLRAD